MQEHKGEEYNVEWFSVQVCKFTRSPFERQILESVMIQEEKKKHIILNSKSEYNRCAVPRLTSRLGDTVYDDIEDKIKEEKKMEEILEARIRQLKKEVYAKRWKDEERVEREKEEPSTKRRKVAETILEEKRRSTKIQAQLGWVAL